MFQKYSKKLIPLIAVTLISGSLLFSGQAKADHDSRYLLLAAPLILHSLFHDRSYSRHTRSTRRQHNHQHHQKPRRQSHSYGRYNTHKGPKRHRH